MAQASAVLRLPVSLVEMVICRGPSNERPKRFSVDDMLQENAATIILVNQEEIDNFQNMAIKFSPIVLVSILIVMVSDQSTSASHFGFEFR